MSYFNFKSSFFKKYSTIWVTIFKVNQALVYIRYAGFLQNALLTSACIHTVFAKCGYCFQLALPSMHYITPYMQHVIKLCFRVCLVFFLILSVVLRTPVCWFCQSLCAACRHTSRVNSCLCGLASKKKKKIPALALLPQEQVLCWLIETLYCILSPSISVFFFFFCCQICSDSSVPKQSILCDTLIARCCVLKHRCRYKQETATGYWQDFTETQVPLTQCTRAHFSTVSQWDRSEHALSEPELAWLSSDLACHPAVQSTVVSHSDSGQYREKHGFTQISLICFQNRLAPSRSPTLPLPSYLTQLIETLNAGIKSCTIQPFYVNSWLDVLLVSLRPFKVRELETVRVGNVCT